MAIEISVRDEEEAVVVTVREGETETKHRVRVPEDYYRQLTAGKLSKADCVKASFRFLLDRERKESILHQFDLTVISRYFPEFESEFRRYVS